MSSLPPETGLGYTPPVVRQLSVFLENKVGRLHDMLEVFQREPGLELCALSVLEASEHSVVRLIPTNAKLASDLLKEDGWAFTATDLLVVRLQPGQTIEGLCLALGIGWFWRMKGSGFKEQRLEVVNRWLKTFL